MLDLQLHMDGACRPGSTDGLTELYALRSHCKQLEEQVDQQQQVIRYLQANSGASNPEQAERLQDENTALRSQLASLQDELEEIRFQRPGTSGMCSALKQQVSTLQVCLGTKHLGSVLRSCSAGDGVAPWLCNIFCLGI